MYLSQHLIKTSAVLHPVHDELIVSQWKVSGRRASITFSDNGSRGARGMTPHADMDLEFLVPLTDMSFALCCLSASKSRSKCWS